MICDFLLENAHSFWNSDHYNLHQIDLHQNENLVQRAEYIPHRSHIDPLSPIVAQNVNLMSLSPLPIQDKTTSQYCQST